MYNCPLNGNVRAHCRWDPDRQYTQKLEIVLSRCREFESVSRRPLFWAVCDKCRSRVQSAYLPQRVRALRTLTNQMDWKETNLFLSILVPRTVLRRRCEIDGRHAKLQGSRGRPTVLRWVCHFFLGSFRNLFESFPSQPQVISQT